MQPAATTLAVLSTAALLTASGCASDSSATDDDTRPTVVVTTNILGDVIESATDGLVDVEVIMPIGAEPHDFAPSARQAEAMENADLLVVNGSGFEAGMTGIIANVAGSGTPVFSFADSVPIVDGDPHFWTDPSLVSTGLDGFEDRLAALDAVDPDALATTVDAYQDELAAIEESVEQSVETVPVDRRVLVTNHEVFGYFATRFGFEVVGAVIPSLTTDAEPSAAGLEDLADVIIAEGVSVIFGETTQSTDVAEALAAEVGGDVAIVELFSESLGDAGSGAATYIDMMTTNAELISTALATTA